MTKKPDYPLDQPMRVSNPTGKAIDFQHNGGLHSLPKGVSTWPFEIAERLERKFGASGVRITFVRDEALLTEAAPEPEVPAVAPEAVTEVEVVPESVPEADSTPAPEVELPLDTPASTDVETPAEPEPPAEPKEP